MSSMATSWVIAEGILLFLPPLRLIILLFSICLSSLKSRRKLTFVDHHRASNVVLLPPPSWSPHPPCGIGIIKVGKLRSRKVIARKRQSQDSIPGLSGSKALWLLPHQAASCGFYSKFLQ